MKNSSEVTGRALVLSQISYGEADVLLDLYIEGFGRTLAKSRGVKYLKSKLRYSLEPYSISVVSIIQIKSGGWQLINSDLVSNLYYDLSGKRREVLVRIIDLLIRVLPPEDPIRIIDHMIDVLSVGDYDLLDQYLLVASNLLVSLGYLDQDKVEQVIGSAKKQAVLPRDKIKSLQLLIIKAIENSQL